MTRIIPSNFEQLEGPPKIHEDNKKGIKVLSGAIKILSKVFTKKHVNVMHEGKKVTLSTRSIKRYANIDNLKSEEIRRLCNLSKQIVGGSKVSSEYQGTDQTDIKNLMMILDKSNSSDNLKDILLRTNNENCSKMLCRELIENSISKESLNFLLDQGANLETLNVVLPDTIKCDEKSLDKLIKSTIHNTEKARILLSIQDTKIDTDRLNLILDVSQNNSELYYLLINSKLSSALQKQNMNAFVDFLDTLDPEISTESIKAIDAVLTKVVSDSRFFEDRIENLIMPLVKLISQNPQEVNSDVRVANRLKEIILYKNASNKLDLLSLSADKFDSIEDSLNFTQNILEIRILPEIVEAYESANIDQKEKLDAFIGMYEEKKSIAKDEGRFLGFPEDDILKTALDDDVSVEIFQTLMTYFSSCSSEEEYNHSYILLVAIKSPSISKNDFDKLIEWAGSTNHETLKAKVKALESGLPSDIVFQDHGHFENYMGVISDLLSKTKLDYQEVLGIFKSLSSNQLDALNAFNTILIEKHSEIQNVDSFIQSIKDRGGNSLFELLRQELLGDNLGFLINWVDRECDDNEQKTIVEGFVEAIIDAGLPDEFLSDTLTQLNKMQLSLRNKMYSNRDSDGFIVNRDLENGYDKLFYSIQRARLSLGSVMFEEAPALGLKLDDTLQVGQKLYSVGSKSKIESIYKNGIDVNRTLKSKNSQWGNLELGPGVYFSTEGPAYASYDLETGTILDYMIELEVVEEISGASLPKHGNLERQLKNQVGTQNRNLSRDEIKDSFLEIARDEDNSYLRGQTPKGATELVLYRPSKKLKIVGLYKYIGDDNQGKAKFKKLEIKDVPSDQWYKD